MKKNLFAFVVFLICCVSVQAQKSALIMDLAYRNKFNYTNWGVGLQYKYNLPANFRAATDFVAYFPEESSFGLDFGINLQYQLHVCNNLSIYPFVGGIMSNHSFSGIPNNVNETGFGLSFGAGVEYNVSKKGFLNFDYRYNLIDKKKNAWYTDYSLIRIGYGVRF